jgi:hypothetical protein
MVIVSACLARDLPVYRFAFEGLMRHVPGARPHVISRREDFGKFRDACGSELQLLDENGMVPGMDLGDLRRTPLPFFPAGAGWYFQQFLKWACADLFKSERGYLIWDADTILLRPLEFCDATGRTWLTTSTEYHPPYFETFQELLGFPPARKISFISQHQWIERDILSELLEGIGGKSNSGWAWEIIRRMQGKGTNLFSEYETYGHYCLVRHPERCVVRDVPWTRAGRNIAGFPPEPAVLQALSRDYAFASFESNRSLRGLCVHWLRKILRWY